MPEIPPEIRAQIASMTDTEYSAFVAQVRAPDATEALRSAVGQHLSGKALDAFMFGVDASKFTDADGNVNQQTLNDTLRGAFGINIPKAGVPQYGQNSGNAPGPRPGDAARQALAKRYGTQVPDDTTAAAASSARGAGAKAALARRFPQQKEN